jgi:hypothetical protein
MVRKSVHVTPEPHSSGKGNPQESATGLPHTNGASNGRLRSRKPGIASKQNDKAKGKRKRTSRPYPACSFEDALGLAQEILKQAPEGKIRRLTFLKATDRSATSSSTHALITNSSKYNITKGSYAAEWLETTVDGKLAASSETPPRAQLQARFNLAIEGIPPLKALYEEHKNKRLPSHEVMKDFLHLADSTIDNLSECIDLFIVNAKYLGLLQTIAGSETLIPIEHVIDELKPDGGFSINGSSAPGDSTGNGVCPPTSGEWDSVCFYISPIGEEDSEQRQHSDLFLNHLVEPALREFNMRVIRADSIGQSGMITSQILEHILKAKLVIADLSFQNPNVFYELALRHACKLPIVQIIRKSDRIPFDVDQVRTVQIDTEGIYTLVPRLETYRSEIAIHVRQALSNAESVSNPLTVFCPGLTVSMAN